LIDDCSLSFTKVSIFSRTFLYSKVWTVMTWQEIYEMLKAEQHLSI